MIKGGCWAPTTFEPEIQGVDTGGVVPFVLSSGSTDFVYPLTFSNCRQILKVRNGKKIDLCLI